MLRHAIAASALAAAVLLTPTAAFAKTHGGGGGGSPSPTGYDVSYPQCGTALPTGQTFGIVGVNSGIVFSPNPCLSTEYAWAVKSTMSPRVSFYANTADPGPTSPHWPTGQAGCPSDTLTTGCSYDYGWNAAADSFQDAVAASTPAAAQAAPWWLDVESANSWQNTPSYNIADLQGAVAYLQSVGVSTVGIYTNGSSWSSITGNSTAFARYPSWVPGARSLRGAESNCTASITGGMVTDAQYPLNGYDADYRCP